MAPQHKSSLIYKFFVGMACHSWFDTRHNGFKPEKKAIFWKKFFCKFSTDCCDQSSSDNLYIKLLSVLSVKSKYMKW